MKDLEFGVLDTKTNQFTLGYVDRFGKMKFDPSSRSKWDKIACACKTFFKVIFPKYERQYICSIDISYTRKYIWETNAREGVASGVVYKVFKNGKAIRMYVEISGFGKREVNFDSYKNEGIIILK